RYSLWIYSIGRGSHGCSVGHVTTCSHTTAPTGRRKGASAVGVGGPFRSKTPAGWMFGLGVMSSLCTLGPGTLRRVQAKHILALDQGTTGTTALVLSLDGSTLGRHTQEFTQYFPKPGWVEHEPEELWQSTLTAIAGALADARLSGSDIAAIGITN